MSSGRRRRSAEVAPEQWTPLQGGTLRRRDMRRARMRRTHGGDWFLRLIAFMAGLVSVFALGWVLMGGFGLGTFGIGPAGPGPGKAQASPAPREQRSRPLSSTAPRVSCRFASAAGTSFR